MMQLSSWGRPSALGLLLWSTMTSSIAAQVKPAARVEFSWTTVNYLSGNLVYLSVGTKQGVRQGAHLEVVRAGEVVADLTAAYTSSNQSSCTVTKSTATMLIGDSVRYVAVVDTQVSTAVRSSTGAATARRTSAARRSLRGRVGLRYLVVQSGVGTTLTQPAFDLRLDGQDLGGTGLGVTVDVRAQRSTISSTSGTLTSGVPTSLNRVYQGALFYNRGTGGARVTVGRQFAGALSTIGIFDGLALDFDHTHWTYGVLAGTQPELATFGFSTATQDYGVYLQRHNKRGGAVPWSFTMGAIGSYTNGQIDREFGYLRTTYNSRRLSIFASQEIDVNRGWKRAVEGSAVTMTSSFLTAQISPTDGVSFNGGFDNRRNVRLYRDYVNPEIAFDDSFREGVWGGTSLTFLRRLRITADARNSSGGTEGTARSFTESFSATRLTPLHLGFRGRTTQYSGTVSTGSLSSVSLEVAPVAAIRLEVTGGVRNTSYPLSGAAATRLTWTGVDADISIGRRLYLMLSTYREAGAPDRTIQSYFALSYRF
jgi:hypothetical protein